MAASFTAQIGGWLRRRPVPVTVAVTGLLAFAAAPTSATVPLPGASQPWTARPAAYGVVMEPDVRVAMNDGVRLSVDVLRPADSAGSPVPGRFPVLLTQTPYNKKPGVAQSGRSGLISYRNEFLVQRGYVQVIAEVRGTGSSEGAFDVFSPRQQADGAELVAWAASPERPWSNGRVGLLGSSYAAMNQLLTAGLRPPALRAIFPVSTASDLYRDLVVPGGQMDTTFMPLWFTFVTSFGFLPPSYTPSDPAGAAAALAGHAGNLPAIAAMASDLGGGGDLTYDGPWWWERSMLDGAGRLDLPVFLVGGWRDLFPRGGPVLFERLQAAGRTARMVIGPWDHWDMVGDASGPTPLRFDGHSLDEWQLRWFDRHVEGRPDPELDALPPVTFCPMGEDGCRLASTWPPQGVTYRPLFLHGPTSATVPGRLQGGPPGQQPPDRLMWHQGSGGCTRSSSQWGWSDWGGVDSPCDADQRANDATGLVYDLAVTETLRITGPIAARLFVETNGRDGFLTLRLEGVAPDGRVTQLSSGGLAISFRALDSARSLVADGHVVRPYHPFTRQSVLPVNGAEIYEVWVEIVATAATVPAGHTLRLAVQTSDWPHQSPSLRQTAAFTGNLLSLHHDAQHPSELVVPLQP